MPGPTFAGPYHVSGNPQESPYSYGRFHNPTWSAYEQALGELEGGQALVFASGMAAVAAIFGVVLTPGDRVVLPADSYYAVRVLAAELLAPAGIEVRLAPTAANAQEQCVDGARLLWIETPSNPNLDVCDIARLCQQAHSAGALVVVDNTTACLLNQEPLALGADISIASDTKAVTGHSDLILGHLAVKDAALLEKLRTYRTRTGAVAGPMEVWLAHRSLATLDVRLERQCANALEAARHLSKHPKVLGVRYPGLESDPSFSIAVRQMRRFGSVLSFTLSDQASAERFLSACRLVYQATSFGSLHTTAERRARWGGDAVPEGFIRMNVGCEDVRDLLEDFDQALDAS
jgi:cystathionine gamma-lyase